MTPQRNRQTLAVLGLLLVGLGAGLALNRPLSKLIKSFRGDDGDKPVAYRRADELMLDAFNPRRAVLADGPLVLPPCTQPDDLGRQVEQVCGFPADALFDAYGKMELLAADRADGRLKVAYQLDRSYDAWAYATSGPADTRTAVLIIPGSGTNEATKILRGDPKDYHGPIAAAAARCGDTFILVKPNEDFLAIHDGRGRLSHNYVVNWLLNRGQSVSARYLADSLALVKHLKSAGRYDRVFVVGLSQGGTAALLNALMSQPTGAVVASGWSVNCEQPYASGFGQLVVPGIESRFDAAAVRAAIERSPTWFLFSFGRAERGIYRVEAEDGDTARFLAPLANVRVVVHDGGHAFDLPAVERFLGEQPAAAAEAP